MTYLDSSARETLREASPSRPRSRKATLPRMMSLRSPSSESFGGRSRISLSYDSRLTAFFRTKEAWERLM